MADTPEAASELFASVQKVLGEICSNTKPDTIESSIPEKENLALRMAAQGENVQVCQSG